MNFVLLLLVSSVNAVKVGVLWERTTANAKLTQAVEFAAWQLGYNDTFMWRDAMDTSVEAAMDRMHAASPDLVGFIGPRSSGESRFAARNTALPVLSPTATAAFLDDTTSFPNFRRVIPSDALQAQALAAFLHELSFGSAVVLYDEGGSWASDFSFLLVSAANFHNIRVTPFAVSHLGDVNMSVAPLAPFRARLCLGAPKFCEALLSAAATAPQPFFGSRGNIWIVPEAPAQYTSIAWLADLFGTHPSMVALTPTWHRLAAEQLAQFEAEPTWKEASAFDVTTGLLLAARAGKACNSSGTVDGLCMLERLDSTTFTGAGGTIHFRAGRSPLAVFALAQLGQNRWNQVGTFDPSSEELTLHRELIRWPAGQRVFDSDRVPVERRLAGQTLVFGLPGQDPGSSVVEFVNLMQAKGNFTAEYLKLPCDHDIPCEDYDTEEGKNWPQGPGWSEFLCSYFGGEPTDSSHYKPEFKQKLIKQGRFSTLPMIGFCIDGPECSIKDSRLACGLQMSTTVFTYSFRIFANTETTERDFSPGWQWFYVFKWDLWLAFIFASVLNALAMWAVEGNRLGPGRLPSVDKKDTLKTDTPKTVDLPKTVDTPGTGSDKLKTDTLKTMESETLVRYLWISFATVLGASNFEPKRPLGRFIESLWMMLIFVLVAAFTANMASVLTITRRSNHPVQTIDDICQRGLKVCVPKRCWENAHTMCVQIETHTCLRPGNGIKLVDDDLSDIYISGFDKIGPLVLDGVECDAGVGYDYQISRYLAQMTDREGTKWCKVDMLGEQIGPATSKAMVLANSISQADSQAINFIVAKMHKDGDIEQWIKHAFHHGESRATCTAEQKETSVDDELKELTFTFGQVWGIFALFGVGLVFTCLGEILIWANRHHLFRGGKTNSDAVPAEAMAVQIKAGSNTEELLAEVQQKLRGVELERDRLQSDVTHLARAKEQREESELSLRKIIEEERCTLRELRAQLESKERPDPDRPGSSFV